MPFDEQMERDWQSALAILAEAGEDVDALLEDAGRVVSYYHDHPAPEDEDEEE